MSVLNGNQERWDELCALYGKMRSEGHNSYFRVGRLALHLRNAVTKALGCPTEYVTFYKYDITSIPHYDSARQVKNNWEAVSEHEAGWSFGLGVLMEISPNHYPKTIVTFPVEVTVRQEGFDLRSPLFQGERSIRGNSYYSDDLDEAGEAVYQGLRGALRDSSDEGMSGIGFHALSEG